MDGLVSFETLWSAALTVIVAIVGFVMNNISKKFDGIQSSIKDLGQEDKLLAKTVSDLRVHVGEVYAPRTELREMRVEVRKELADTRAEMRDGLKGIAEKLDRIEERVNHTFKE